MSDSDPLSCFLLAKLRTVDDWENALAETIPTVEMLEWFSDVLDTHIEAQAIKPEYLNLFCAVQKRFRALAHFSRKLTPEQRQLFIDQADTITELIRGIWGQDTSLMQNLDAALAASSDYHRRFGWPSAAWDLFDFDEL